MEQKQIILTPWVAVATVTDIVVKEAPIVFSGNGGVVGVILIFVILGAILGVSMLMEHRKKGKGN